MQILAQVEATAIASEVVKALAEHKSANGGGLDAFMFLGALLLLFVGSFYVIRWMMTHNQTCVREITTDHKEACKVITETYKAETATMRADHNEDRRAFREGLQALKGVQ